MLDFNQVIREIECVEPASKGNFFTWSSTRGEGRVAKSRLDRVLVNGRWFEEYGQCFSQALNPGISDHCPILLTRDNVKRKTPFRFFNFWAAHSRFEEIVKEGWDENIVGSKMFQTSKKLCLVKKGLQKLDRRLYSRIGRRVEAAKAQLDDIQQRLLNEDPTVSSREDEIRCVAEYRELCKQEESFLKQKSRQMWMKLGDKNSGFFYKKCMLRGARNRVLSLRNDEGEMIEGQETLMDEAIRFFAKLLNGNRIASEVPFYIHDIVTNRLTHEQKREIGKEVTKEEIEKVVNALPNDKSPGPDGFNAYFFKKAWNVIGNLVTEGILEFFKNKRMLKQWNSTILTLIPKMQSPQTMNDFRPISCCNVIYKIIAKILSNRLKSVLNSIVGINQSAFIPDRSISHNILLMQSLIKGYGRKQISPRVAFKIDIRKAFDSIKWDAIREMLLILDFPISYIQMIMQCLSTAHFIVSLNGMLDGFFKSSCGVRQGDPLSPYLFVIVMDLLNCIIKMLLRTEIFHYHPFCSDLAITHICFADDLFMLAKADVDSVLFLKKALTIFTSLTGLEINYDKSFAYFGGVSEELQVRLSLIMGMKIGNLPVKYLGVPLITGALQSSHCRPLLEKLKNRLHGCGSSKLSYAGRVELARSVLGGITGYWSRQFTLPKKVLKEIDGEVRKFIWGSNSGKVQWQTVCKPKVEGGLGLRSAKEWNIVLGVKHLWDIANMKVSLWVKWVHSRFIKRQTIWSCKPSHLMAWSLRKIFHHKEELGRIADFKVGDGRTLSFWFEPWYRGEIIAGLEQFKDLAIGYRCRSASVSEMANGEWNALLQNSVKGRLILGELRNLHLLEGIPDIYAWKASTTKDIWDILRERGQVKEWSQVVWGKKGIPRHQFILWLAIQNKLMTRDRLSRFVSIEDVNCCFCRRERETIDHLFFVCPFTSSIWSKAISRLRGRIPMTWNQVKEWAVAKLSGDNFEQRVGQLCLAATVYEIWRCRNALIFQKIDANRNKVWDFIVEDLQAVVNDWRRVKRHVNNWMSCLQWDFNHTIFL